MNLLRGVDVNLIKGAVFLPFTIGNKLVRGVLGQSESATKSPYTIKLRQHVKPICDDNSPTDLNQEIIDILTGKLVGSLIKERLTSGDGIESVEVVLIFVDADKTQVDPDLAHIRKTVNEWYQTPLMRIDPDIHFQAGSKPAVIMTIMKYDAP